jgi:hypothetical protein
MSAIDKLKNARKTNIEAGNITFTVIRPTPMQAMDWLTDMAGNPLSSADVQQFIDQHFSLNNKVWRHLAQQAVSQFVVDWPNVKELDIIPGGDGSKLAFDKELFLVWVEDYPEIITTLGFKIFEVWVNYLTLREEAEKKPDPGISQDG